MSTVAGALSFLTAVAVLAGCGAPTVCERFVAKQVKCSDEYGGNRASASETRKATESCESDYRSFGSDGRKLFDEYVECTLEVDCANQAEAIEGYLDCKAARAAQTKK